MRAAAREFPDGDRLTRTTLLVEFGSDAKTAAAVIGALHRVPGVLIAEVDPAGGKVVVAHDGAVKLEALLVALERGGFRASIAGGMPAALASVARPSTTSTIVFIGITWMIFTIFTGVAILDPSLVRGLTLLPVIVLSVFLFLFTRSFVVRRP